jgi:hypothetical protein
MAPSAWREATRLLGLLISYQVLIAFIALVLRVCVTDRDFADLMRI